MTLKLRRALIGVAYVAFASKLLIPLGYMPAALSGGSPVTLCPDGLPAGLVESLAGHSGHGAEDGPGGHERAGHWDHCSLGALAATPALAGAHVFDLPDGTAGTVPSAHLLPATHARPLSFRARAPPRAHSSLL